MIFQSLLHLGKNCGLCREGVTRLKPRTSPASRRPPPPLSSVLATFPQWMGRNICGDPAVCSPRAYSHLRKLPEHRIYSALWKHATKPEEKEFCRSPGKILDWMGLEVLAGMDKTRRTRTRMRVVPGLHGEAASPAGVQNESQQ